MAGLLQIGDEPAGGAMSLLAGVLTVLGSIGAAYLLHALDARIHVPLGRFVLLYLVWLAAGSMLLFVAHLILGATSMAAVEGLVTPSELRRQAGSEALRLLLPAQLCILPWVGLATALLHRLRMGRRPGPAGDATKPPLRALDAGTG